MAAKVPPFDGCHDFFPLVEALVSDKDVSDHHALIPTMALERADLHALPVGERNLFLLVCCKLMCAAAEPHIYETVTATFDCGGHTFTAKGKQVIDQGWREIDLLFHSFLKEKPENNGYTVLPDFTEGQTFADVTATITEHFTSPPKPYTEDTLLAAMERAGAEDMPENTERKGLGTPATRAAIIEKLVASGFVARKGKNLCATKDGINLVTVLPEPLTSPMLTAEWEQQLSEIAKGSIRPEGFLQGIQTTMEQLVHTYTTALEDGTKRFTPDREPIGKCPRCGQPVYMGKHNFYCGDRTCGFVLWKDNRFWTTKKSP
jgi:DNA topoisomerase-3